MTNQNRMKLTRAVVEFKDLSDAMLKGLLETIIICETYGYDGYSAMGNWIDRVIRDLMVENEQLKAEIERLESVQVKLGDELHAALSDLEYYRDIEASNIPDASQDHRYGSGEV